MSGRRAWGFAGAMWLVVASGVLFAQPAAAAADRLSVSSDLAYFGGSSEWDAATQHPDWMSWLPGNLSLRDVTIPGTHDSGTYAVRADLPITTEDFTDQSMNIISQLQSGIRFFDIRITCITSTAGAAVYDMPVFHGAFLGVGGPLIAPSLDLYDVANAFHTYFLSHANETAVVQISHYGMNGDNICVDDDTSVMSNQFPLGSLDMNSFSALFDDQYARIQQAFGNLFYTDSTKQLCSSIDDAPTMQQARGHVVIERGFSGLNDCSYNAMGDPVDLDTNLYYGDPGPNNPLYDDHSKASICDDTDLAKFNNYVAPNMAAIAAGKATHGWLVGTWTQASNEGSGCTDKGFSYLSAQRLNPRLLNLLLNGAFGPGANFGFVAMDYPGPALISALVLMNLHHATSSAAYVQSGDFQQGAQDLFHGYRVGTTDGGAPERAIEQKAFFSAAQPNALWHSVVVSATTPSSVAMVDNGVEFEGTANAFSYYVWQTRSGAPPQDADFKNGTFQLRVDQLVIGSAATANMAGNISQTLDSYYPDAQCSVLVVNGGIGDPNTWSVQTYGFYYAAKPRGSIFTYVMCVERTSGLGGAPGAPVPIVGTPNPVVVVPTPTSPAPSHTSSAMPSGVANTNASMDTRLPLIVATILLVGGAVLVGAGGPARHRAGR